MPNRSNAFRPAEAFLDRGNWDPRLPLTLTEIKRAENARLIREWERANNQPWPREADGRRYDVAHIKALADGGTDTLDNIRPLPRSEHIAGHVADGDFQRFARRRWIAQAFGGRVVRGLGILSILPNLVGLLSGRIRQDTPLNALSDLVGVPSPADEQRLLDEARKPGGLGI